MILYEHPFNERVRTYLRLEHLFQRFDELLRRDQAIDNHFALITLFELIDGGSRSDLKSDLLKDMERHMTDNVLHVWTKNTEYKISYQWKEEGENNEQRSI